MSGLIVKWYVTKWHDVPERKEFLRETAHTLVELRHGRERKVLKATQWGRYYDTRDDAQAAINCRKAYKADEIAMRRVRDAAPELLEALESVMGNCLDSEGLTAAYAKARAAIAKARGEQP